MLSGQQPYSADTPMGVVIKHITEPVPEILNIIPSLPPEMDTLIKRALAKDKAKRYSTAVELAKALNLIAFGNEGNFTSTTNTGIRTGVYKATGQSSRGKTGLVVAGIVILMAAVGVFLLRNQLFAPPQVDPTPTSLPTAIPTKIPTETPTATLPPTPTPVPVTETASAIPFAPACADGIAIPTPVVKETNKICTEKKPYTIISVPQGAVLEPIDKELTCLEESTGNGKTIISCTGKRQLYSYMLKVCIPPIVSSADSGKCDQGSTYDTANQCCLVPPAEGAGCTTFKVDLRGCE
jgi:serine/threonine protein kinase